MRYLYKVAPTVIVRASDNFFTYHSDTKLEIGTVVRVPVGKSLRNGVVIGVETQKPRFKTRPIHTTLTTKPLPRQLLGLAFWISSYYCTHLATVLQTVLPAGLHKTRRTPKQQGDHASRNRTSIVLSSEQRISLDQLGSGKDTFLLHGVTGSGKTQVYIEAAKRMREAGKSTIVLVPEISLTPQLVAEFANHFSNLFITHSGLGESKRHSIWLEALNNDKPCVVIGPRSALFMPVRKLGLIVVDECHEPSYKQDQSPRYSALRAASVLAKSHGAKTIFGSATPGVSEYFLASINKNPILKLTKPVKNGAEAETTVVDLKNKSLFTKHRFLSDQLLQGINSSLDNGLQALIFHNRRGSTPTTLCENCGWVAQCPNCYLPVTLHADQHQLRCHLCGLGQSVPPSCPTCNEPTIAFRGVGTKLIETELSKLFPKARIARFDADTATKDSAHLRYQEMYNGEIDIIIGTQMLAKGFDLPKLAVVGVIQADSGLLLPDYQSEERVFQLIYQVIGRVGRQDHEGKVIVQTYNPDNPSIKAALRRDYKQFYEIEIAKRKSGGFPPHRYLLKLTCAYKTEKDAINASLKMARLINTSNRDLEVLGPAPAFYERLGNKYRWQLVIKSRRRSELVELASSVTSPWQFDLDPQNIL